ncbi:hypothetical protein HETIRDRAFT_313698 [Heterobasidion irregulare TC 32-1]|uniref:RRM domain-containing protein n=1 Tax=Heterobasidion irregulare (strain TC 32-1) TaxID=747525 RepID=W4KH43_HETIT|nr:uncharacterized protein HETIRDRAFT_313698 [Heterobasidion irregulare TC 32-1]ETW84356.1 hypothetical protein HETIRDRAFT_313698 [Heterobasidion irregulare TC 32-1]
MTRFRVPQSSSDVLNVNNPDAGTSAVRSEVRRPQPRRINRPRVSRKAFAKLPNADPVVKTDGGRVRSKSTTKARKRAEAAEHAAQKKEAARQEQAERRKRWKYVFVGNLSSNITVADLSELFAPCGTIKDITIRCSQGSVVSSRGEKGRYYASIIFERAASAVGALKLDKHEYRGATITVSPIAFDLPEAQAIQTAQSITGNEKPNMVTRLKRALFRQATLLSLDDPDANPQNHIMGFSFANTVA